MLINHYIIIKKLKDVAINENYEDNKNSNMFLIQKEKNYLNDLNNKNN